MNSNYILIAEDDADDQFLMNNAFKDIASDFELVFVENGIEVLNHFEQFDSKLRESLPALLIMDLNMPRKNGKDTLEILKHKDYFLKFPTVVFSTTGNDREIKKCKDLGVKDFFVKPSNYGSLVDVVRHFTTIAKQVKEI